MLHKNMCDNIISKKRFTADHTSHFSSFLPDFREDEESHQQAHTTARKTPKHQRTNRHDHPLLSPPMEE